VSILQDPNPGSKKLLGNQRRRPRRQRGVYYGIQARPQHEAAFLPQRATFFTPQSGRGLWAAHLFICENLRIGPFQHLQIDFILFGERPGAAVQQVFSQEGGPVAAPARPRPFGFPEESADGPAPGPVTGFFRYGNKFRTALLAKRWFLRF
jgi:hypothetical protein